MMMIIMMMMMMMMMMRDMYLYPVKKHKNVMNDLKTFVMSEIRAMVALHAPFS